MYKKDIRLIYRDILRELFESSNGLQAFTLYSRCLINPEDILRFIDVYGKKGFISISEDKSKLELTAKGRQECAAEIQSLSNEAGIKSDNYLSTILTSPINIYSPYVPVNLAETAEKDIKPF
ncbi:MAG: hypothetical protein NC207_07310 [Bacteroides sp.]|nr:hypothetical protein [Bacteroides sp.]